MSKAFTLLEIVLYVFIFTIIGMAIFSFTAISGQVNSQSQTTAELSSQGAALMQKIIRYVNKANYYDGIIYPDLGMSSTSLSVDTDTPTTTPTIINLSNNYIMVKQGTGATIAISSNKVKVSNLLFENLGAPMTDGVIRIKFDLELGNTQNQGDFNQRQSFISAANPLTR